MQQTSSPVRLVADEYLAGKLTTATSLIFNAISPMSQAVAMMGSIGKRLQ